MKSLDECTETIEVTGRLQRVIEDGALLSWALAHGHSPRAAQLEALRRGILPLRYSKNVTALSVAEQERLCSSSVLVCGCGGLGGIILQLLARAGIGGLRVVDGDDFMASNLNRQLLSSTPALARPKVEVAAEIVAASNPFVEVEAVQDVLEEGNVVSLVRGVDLVLDALDNIVGRLTLAAAARHLGLPFIHGGVAGWWGQLSTFLATSSFDLGDVYGERRDRDPMEQDLGVLGPAAAVIGSLQALEAVRILIGRPPAYSGQMLYFDGESGRFELVPFGREL